jgi:hypothetical protein
MVSHERIELRRRIRAYAMRVAILLLHLPHALQTALQVAAPQHDAAAVAICVGRTSVWVSRGGHVCAIARLFTYSADAGNGQQRQTE